VFVGGRDWLAAALDSPRAARCTTRRRQLAPILLQNCRARATARVGQRATRSRRTRLGAGQDEAAEKHRDETMSAEATAERRCAIEMPTSAATAKRSQATPGPLSTETPRPSGL